MARDENGHVTKQKSSNQKTAVSFRQLKRQHQENSTVKL